MAEDESAGGPPNSTPGRPIVHTEPWAKITVVLLDRHVAYLDRLAIDIRLRHGKAISRAEIIRGLMEAAFQYPDLEEFLRHFAGTIQGSES